MMVDLDPCNVCAVAYRFLPGWDITVGRARNGGQPQMVLWEVDRQMTLSTSVPDRDISALSPKFSLGYEPGHGNTVTLLAGLIGFR